jgi:hypothetical protein
MTQPFYRDAAEQFRTPLYRSAAAGPLVRERRFGVILLCALPFIDTIIAQLHNGLHLSAGDFSLPQVVHGGLLLVAWLYIINAGRKNVLTRRVYPSAFIILLFFTAVSVRSIANAGAFNFSAIVMPLQVVYWCTMWILTTQICTTHRISWKVLNAYAFASLITAMSVFWGYMSGLNTAVYGIRASSGLFSSGKGIAGMLAAAAFIFAYLSMKVGRKTYLLFAALCTAAAYLTYARAGLVAMGIAAVWASAWAVIRTGPSKWIRRFVVLLAVSIVGVILVVGVKDMEHRWQDLNEGDKAGSGRILLWTLAWNFFTNGSPSQQLFGIGIDGMLNMTYASKAHIAIHTHSDLFDLITIGGFAGILTLLTIPASIVALGRLLHSGIAEYGLFWCIAWIMAGQGLLTGQFFLPEAMTIYLVTMTAAAVHGATLFAPDAQRGFLRPRHPRVSFPEVRRQPVKGRLTGPEPQYLG